MLQFSRTAHAAAVPAVREAQACARAVGAAWSAEHVTASLAFRAITASVRRMALPQRTACRRVAERQQLQEEHLTVATCVTAMASVAAEPAPAATLILDRFVNAHERIAEIAQPAVVTAPAQAKARLSASVDQVGAVTHMVAAAAPLLQITVATRLAQRPSVTAMATASAMRAIVGQAFRAPSVSCQPLLRPKPRWMSCPAADWLPASP